MDTAGYRHGYRPGSKIEMNLDKPIAPKRNNRRRTEDQEDGDNDDYEKCWPAPAWHFEDYYEYPFDSGNHRICKSARQLFTEWRHLQWFGDPVRYAFKENPDTSVLPEYGDAGVGESFWN